MMRTCTNIDIEEVEARKRRDDACCSGVKKTGFFENIMVLPAPALSRVRAHVDVFIISSALLVRAEGTFVFV